MWAVAGNMMKESRKDKRKNRSGKIWIVSGIAAIIILVCFSLYVSDYYHSDSYVKDYLSGTENVKVNKEDFGLFLDGPGEEAALVFYPGAKVEYTAYLPMLSLLAERGVDCFLVKMPCNLAIFGKNKAGSCMKDRNYESWYIGGHSLGGAMAASFASEHPDDLEGLVLFAAYPTENLKDDSFFVLSVYGSEDRILSMEKVEEGRGYMPDHYTEICIEGGNHAGFGDYGDQSGDGTAQISREEQQTQTVEEILKITNNAQNQRLSEKKSGS